MERIDMAERRGRAATGAAEAIPAAWGTAAPHGLTEAEAAARLRRDGPNELPQGERRSIVRVALDTAREPMFALLLAAGLLYFVFGDPAEAALLFVFATLSIAIAVVQEARTERALDALRDLSSPRALVVRDGVRRRVPGREVVRDDLIVLAEGDRVPADALVVAAGALETDEAMLTGESVPVRKPAAADGAVPEGVRPGGDGLPVVFSGTLVVGGQGLARVLATGGRTEMGRIGQALGGIEREPPRLRAQTRRLVRIFAAGGVGASLLAALLHGAVRGDWPAAALGGIALAMALLPEEFPLVLTVFTVMGALRIAQARVLTRRAAAIEALGAATVLCTDKTGTLTQNRMAVAELRGGDGRVHRAVDDTAPPWAAALARLAARASRDDAFDPMERALHEQAARCAGGPPPAEMSAGHEFKLRPDLPAMGRTWRTGQDGQALALAVKGAPEAVVRLCRLPPAEAEAALAGAAAMAGRGLRVLGLAEARVAENRRPERLEDAALAFRGLVGLADPVRPEVPDAVRECRAAGIRVAMVTGDHPATASAIAAQAGLDAVPVVTGAELASLDGAAFRARVREAAVFARILPEQKLRIVECLKADGAVVAMTGDGVNDAPALKAAHIGVAMGGRGTDVAREAAAVVLLDDDFGSIVRTVRLGRRIFDNLRKAMGYVLAVHVPIAGLAFLPLVLGLPPLLGPLHVAFLEMVVDPVCSIAFEAEPEEADVMRRPPRDPTSPLLPPALMLWSLAQGAAALAAVSAVYLLALRAGLAEDAVRSRAFLALVLANVGLILVNRAFGASLIGAFSGHNPALRWVLAAAAALLGGVLAIPPAAALFRFGPLGIAGAAWAVGAAAIMLVGLEGLKALTVIRRLRS